MFNMTKERFNELGLGYDYDACCNCEDSCIINDELHCTMEPELSIKENAEKFNICPCLDEQRVRWEMTDEEYDAFRHGRLHITSECGCYGAGSKACVESCHNC